MTRRWQRPFDDPIPLPGGRHLVTLKDAAAFILKLPKSAQQSPEWQAAGEAVIMAAEDSEWRLDVLDESGKPVFRLRLLAESPAQLPFAIGPRPIS